MNTFNMVTDPTRWRDYLDLTKPRINTLVLVTTFIGFWSAVEGALLTLRLLWTMLGTGLTVGSANAFNHYWERGTDAMMERTKSRPIPAGRISSLEAVIFAFVTGILGLVLLYWNVNAISALLALIAILSYVPLYTMLKPLTSLSTLIGAIPGAIPPVIGWTAVRGEINFPAVILFFILFFWQPPHFIALALYLKDDYERAGLAMLPVETNERASLRQVVVYTVSLLVVSSIPYFVSMNGVIYLYTSLLFGLVYLGLSLYVLVSDLGDDVWWARTLFLYSIVYLPAVLTMFVVDSTGVSF